MNKHFTHSFAHSSEKEHVDLEIVCTSDKKHADLEIVYTSDKNHVDLEIVYTSDEVWPSSHQKKSKIILGH